MVDAGAAPIDRYVVTEHLSEGGMGAIYVGKKLGAGGFEMEVVLKQLLPEFTQQEEFIDLFLREAKLSATLDHANIVHTIDLVTAGGEYFIVMEYLPGGDLRTLLKKAKRRGKRFSPAAAIYVCREVLSALAYAHVKRDFDGNPLKLIHRDVSPSNVLVSYTGEVKLTDFGIAKAATHNSLFYKVKGKIGYMSPEQARSESLDSRSDLYSLAVCMYEVLTGERLFVHAGLTTSADEIYSQPVPQVSRKIPGLTPDLDAIMARALSIDPNQRFQTAGEFQEALTRCAHRNGLLMSAPELAKELLDACGPTDQWRGDEDDDEVGRPRAGTEVYDAADDDDDDLGMSGPVSIHSIAAASAARSGRASSSKNDFAGLRPKTEVGRFQGVELTSIINMIDLENDGAKPLVDLNQGPRLDSGPRMIGDTPQRPSEAMAMMPTAPRTFGGVPPPPQPGPPPMQPQRMQPMQPPMQPNVQPQRLPPMQPMRQQPYPQPSPQMRPSQPQRVGASRPGSATKRKHKPVIQPWVVIVAILLAAGIAAVIVALSGPNVEVKHDK